MSLSSVSIRNPVFAWMMMLSLILFGAIAFSRMGVSEMPDVDFPVVTVNVTWEGAAPEVMETDVVDVIEDAVMSIAGIREVSSSTRQGMASVTVEFDLDRDIDVALQEVQTKIAQAQQRLPNEIDPPTVNKVNPEDQPIMWLGLSGERPLKDLMTYVQDHLKEKFQTISGVGEVFLGGFLERNLRVWIDPQKLHQYQLTVQDVIDAIKSEHVEMPAGRIETKEKEYNVRAMGEARTPEEFADILISRRAGSPNYKPIYLRDVATIEDGLADVRRISRIMGETAVGIGIKKQRGANAVAVADKVRARVQELQKELPKGMRLGINFDSTRFIKDSIHELNFTLVVSAILTSLICWLFLGSWSSTLNILLAIPTSIVGTFIVQYFFGFTLNTFTVLGLSLVIGIVVDDAIMVLENIVRHREMGEGKADAALKGAQEITFAAFAATLAIIAIFLPVAFMKGIIGKFFFQFGVTISVATALSLLEALTLAPMRCSQFLYVGERKTWLGRSVESSFKGLSGFYRKTLQTALNHRLLVLMICLAVFAVSLIIPKFLRKEFVPAQDQSMFLVRLQTPVGSSIDYTSDKFRLAEDIAMAMPELQRYYAAIGGFGGGEVNTGMMFVTLKQPKQRPKRAGSRKALSQQEIMDRLREQFGAIPDVKVKMQDLSMRGFTAQRGYPIEFTIRGGDWDKLSGYAEQIMDEMEKTGLMVDVDTDYLVGMPEIRVYPDRHRATERGVTMSAISETINALIGGERVGKYTTGGRRYDVRVRLLASGRMKPDDIEKLYVWNNRGEMVQLSDVVTIKENPSLLSITRRGRERAIGLFANVAKGKSQAAAIEKVQQIAGKILPEGYRIVMSGSAQTFQESFQSLTFALWLGIAVAYMVLASQFNSYLHPVIVLLALPFSVTGAFVALWIGDQSLNMYSMIGIILLMGIVKKNSILLVDFTNQRRAAGLGMKEALLEACPIRLRPILMTSVATIAAAIPPALALGPGAETRIPMAISVIGGVVFSTLLSLLAVPCAYSLASRLEKRRNAGAGS